jgi:hypothetical protein
MMKKIKTESEKAGNGETEMRLSHRSPFSFLILGLVLFAAGCQPNQTVLKDVAASPTPMETVEIKKTSVEQDLRDMQAANFDYIFVFRRKDGGTFDKDDRKYLRENTPPETNRFVLSDEGRAFIAGSGFGFRPEQMEALRDRFIVEDFSNPKVKEAANMANTNSNKANTNSNSNNTRANSNNNDKPQANK